MLAGTGQTDGAGGDATECAERDGRSRVEDLGDGSNDWRTDWSAADQGGGP
jgi:hypothetical protein